MFQQPFGIPTHDTNSAQFPHETINVIQDIESRLLALKIGIAQANPQLAPVLLWREQAIAAISSRTPMFSPQSSIGMSPQPGIVSQPALANIDALLRSVSGQTGFPNTGVPLVPGVSPFGAPGVSPFFGLPVGFQSGVVHPYGIATPFRY